MALIRFAEGQQRSGSLGGTVYSRNRYGAYVRSRSVPVNPNTARQVAVRNAVRSLAIAWQTQLTVNQRAKWDEYGRWTPWTNRLGETVYLPGINHYIRTNTQMVALNFARIDEAPTIFTLGTAELVLGCTASEATQVITITFDDTATWANEVGAFQHFFMGSPCNSGIKFFNGPYRYTVSVAGVTPAVSPLPATAPFPIAEDQRIWLRSRIMRADGRLSDFAQIDFLCAA